MLVIRTAKIINRTGLTFYMFASADAVLEEISEIGTAGIFIAKIPAEKSQAKRFCAGDCTSLRSSTLSRTP